MNQNRAHYGQTTCPQNKPVDSPSRGPWLDHSSSAFAYGLTRSACQTAFEKEIKEKTAKPL